MSTQKSPRFEMIKQFLKTVIESPSKTFSLLEFCTYMKLEDKRSLANVYLTELVKTKFIRKVITGTYEVIDTLPETLTFYEFVTLYKSCVNAAKIERQEQERLEELERDTEALLASKAREESALDIQVGGAHYKDLVMQPIELIVSIGLGFIQGNIIKYVSRYKHKNGIEDIKKCAHYAQLAIQLETRRSPVTTRKIKLKTIAEYIDRYCALNKIRGYEQFIINYTALNKWDKVLYGCNKLIESLTKAKENEDLL